MMWKTCNNESIVWYDKCMHDKNDEDKDDEVGVVGGIRTCGREWRWRWWWNGMQFSHGVFRVSYFNPSEADEFYDPKEGNWFIEWRNSGQIDYSSFCRTISRQGTWTKEESYLKNLLILEVVLPDNWSFVKGWRIWFSTGIPQLIYRYIFLYKGPPYISSLKRVNVLNIEALSSRLNTRTYICFFLEEEWNNTLTYLLSCRL